MRPRHLTFDVFILIIIDGICNILAQVLMKKGLIATNISQVTLGNMMEFVARNASSALVWAGIFVYALNFFIWIAILYKVDLSIAMPVGSATYIFVPVIAMMLFHEQIGLTRWAGIILIVIGIHFVSRSGRPPAERAGTHG